MKFHFALIFSFSIASLLAISPADAYIPHRQTIVSRLVKSHGKGSYIIEQDVVFRSNTEPLTLHERWAVSSGESMRLTVTTPGSGKGVEPLRYDVVYRLGKKSLNDSGSIHQAWIGPEFLEGFFHARSNRSFFNDLIAARIVPSEFSRERPKIKKIEDSETAPEPMVRLGRDAGVVTWIFGDPSPVEGKLNPEAWIEQDEFTLRKIRFPSDAEVTADRYSIYARTLRLPRERTVSWNGNSAVIRVTSVRSATPSQLGNSLDPASLSALNKTKTARLPDIDQVKEFYSRFR